MNIEYETSMADIIQFHLYHYKHSPSARRSLFMLQFGLPILLLFLGLVPSLIYGFSIGIGALTPVILLSLLWITFIRFYYWRSIRKQAKRFYGEGKNKGKIHTKHRLFLTEEGVVDTTESGEIKTNWKGVEKIVVTEKYVFIYYQTLAAYIVPKKAFSNESEYKEFIDTARRYYNGVISQGK